MPQAVDRTSAPPGHDKIEVTSTRGPWLFSFKVKMTCGHIETRRMREATAGVQFDEAAEFQVQAPYAECAACCAAKGGGGTADREYQQTTEPKKGRLV